MRDDDLAREPLLRDFTSGDRAMTAPVMLREILALRREIRTRDQRDENAREAATIRRDDAAWELRRAAAELTRLRARLAGRPTPPTPAEVARLTARCGHRQALRASVWLAACGNDGRVVLLYTDAAGVTASADGERLPMAEAVARWGIVRWWPLDGATMEATDWPDAGER